MIYVTIKLCAKGQGYTETRETKFTWGGGQSFTEEVFLNFVLKGQKFLQTDRGKQKDIYQKTNAELQKVSEHHIQNDTAFMKL